MSDAELINEAKRFLAAMPASGLKFIRQFNEGECPDFAPADAVPDEWNSIDTIDDGQRALLAVAPSLVKRLAVRLESCPAVESDIRAEAALAMRTAAAKRLKDEARDWRNAQQSADTPAEKQYRMGGKDALLLAGDYIDSLPLTGEGERGE